MNRTTFGVPSPITRPQMPVAKPMGTPTPASSVQKTMFGAPSPVTPPPAHRVVSAPMPVQQPPAYDLDADATALGTGHGDGSGLDDESDRTVLGPGGSVAGQPMTRNPVTQPRTTPAIAPKAHGDVGMQRTSFGTGGMTGAQPVATPQPPPQSHAPTGAHGGQAPITGPQIGGSGMELVEGGRVHQYELIRELGRGGMGMVWAARDTKLGRRVAIKFLLDASRAVADRFIAEARATAQFQHENIVIIHAVDEIDGMPYMVLEFLEGQPMRGLMGAYQSGTKLAASRVVELALPVAKALEAAHRVGLVHRDLKPENVFVTSTGTVKVLDFGIAKAVASTRDPAAPKRTQYGDIASMNMNLTREGALVGTLPYMSPEQMGVGDVDHRSDIWALGIMLFEMLAGRHPIEPLTSEGLITNAVSDDPMPSIRDVAPELPDGIVQLVDACLRKRVVERIGKASDIVRRLEDLLPGRSGRQLAEGESPYPGLSAFQETDANRFFGRQRDITRMVAKVRELPITGIVGPSGVGKSSFIRAGVGPALKLSGERWDVVTLRPGRAPLASLASVVQKLTTRSGADVQTQVGEHNQLMHRLRTEPGFIGTLLRARARQQNGHILLFVDQFEELYTLVPDLEERRAFTAALAGVADDTAAPLRVVVSMRSDFLDRVAEDPQFMEELSRGLVFLQPPDRNGLREALVAPIEMVGHQFESPEMIEDMLSALAGTSGALPLLQFAAAKLWDARDRQRRLLTVQSYNAIGGISGALATHADDIVAQMNENMRKLTQKIFRRLVTPERTRAIVELADLYQLGDKTEVSRTLEALVGARLLVVQTRGDQGGGGGSVEIVHESLIDRWPTMRRWLDEDQEDAAFVAQLAAAAKQWEAKGHAGGLLWRGEAMEEARRWYALRPRELPPREKAFLEAVFALARRGKRVKRFALTAAFVVLGVVAAGASVALVKIRASEKEASAQAEIAKSREKTTADALAGMKQKEAERLAAEAKQKEAEQQKLAAEEQKLAVEKDKVKAEADKVKAEQEKAQADVQVAQTNEQLQAKVKELYAQKAKMEQTNIALEKTKKELQALSSSQAAEINRLKEEQRKLTTKLK
jgi:eukaryotic-like serine/threonine-protein kinase